VFCEKVNKPVDESGTKIAPCAPGGRGGRSKVG